MVSNVTLKEKNVVFILKTIIFIFISAILILKGEPYFLLVMLYALLSSYDERIYIISNCSSIVLGYILSIDQGNMVVLISALFLLFKLFVAFFIKNQKAKRIMPYVLSSLILFLIYYFQDISFNNFSELILEFSFSLLGFYAFLKVLDSYQYSNNMLDSKDRIIIYAIVPLLFQGVTIFYLLIIRVIHIFLIKCTKFSEALSSIILTSFFFAYLLDISPISLALLILPFLFSFLVSKKHPIFAYLMFYIFSSFFLVKDFLLSSEFYEGIIAILFALLIPESFYYKIKTILEKEEIKEIDKSEKVENVLSYLSVVLDSKLENIKNPLDSTYEELKNDLCLTCERKGVCCLQEIIKLGIKDKYEKAQRKQILDECLYPYKLFKRTIPFHEIYLKEEKKTRENLYLQDLYKKEIENLYYPLKDQKAKNKTEEIKEELNNEGIEVVDIKHFKNTILLEITKYKFDDEETIISVLENVYKKSFVFINKKYSFSLGNYILEFSNKARFKADISTYVKSFSDYTNGDKLFYENEETTFKLLLSDGMGHNKKSAALSEYLIDSIKAYSKIDDSLIRQIKTVNRLIYQKSTLEMYATLDYFVLDLVTLKFTLFKAGSFPTYIYHNHKLKESKKNFTPLGILEKIEPFAFRDVLNEGDIVVFLTDGFGSEVKDKIEDIVANNYEKSSKEITTILKEKLLETSIEEDDKTLVVIKIEKFL